MPRMWIPLAALKPPYPPYTGPALGQDGVGCRRSGVNPPLCSSRACLHTALLLSQFIRWDGVPQRLSKWRGERGVADCLLLESAKHVLACASFGVRLCVEVPISRL